MKFLQRIFQVIYSGYAIIVFVLVMLLIFPFVIVASFFGAIRGGNIIYRLCCFWADIWFPLIFIFHKKIYESAHDPERAYIFLANHISYIDSAVLVKAFRQPVRPLGKAEISRIPIFGFIYRKAIVTVDRSSAEQRAKSIRRLKSVIKKGISVMMFPEGTFNTSGKPLKDFFDGAFRIAIETQTPIKPVLFLDTFDRMHYRSLFSFTPGRSRIVYLDEISVQGLTLQDTHKLKATVHAVMEQKLRAYKAAWIANAV